MIFQADEVTDDLLSTLATFVCTVYSPKGIQIENIPQLIRYLFCKHMAESDKLPPTLGALKQHVLKAHIQARVWVWQTSPSKISFTLYRMDTTRTRLAS
jgi:hypothetical protein